MSSKKCPKCGLWSTSSATRCDCGYNFDKDIIDSSMSCPQCRTLIHDNAVACQNCGALPSNMNNPDERARQVSGKDKVTPLVMAIASLGIGILSFWAYPHLYLSSRFNWFNYPWSNYPIIHTATYYLGCLGGLPLGLIGIVLSALALRKTPNDNLIVIIAVPGFLLSIGGIAGFVWSIVTCQYLCA